MELHLIHAEKELQRTADLHIAVYLEKTVSLTH